MAPSARARPTRDGIAAAIYTVAVVVVSQLGGGNALTLVVAALLALAVVEWVAGRANLSGLTVQRTLPDEAFAGRTARGAFTVTRRGPWSAFDLVVEELDGPRAVARVDVVAPGATVRAATGWTFRRRGLRALRMVRVRSTFPFGMVERSIEVALPVELWVFPAPEPVDAPDDEVGGHAQRRTPEPDDLDDLRPYRQGDRLRDVHWPTSARLGAPHVVVRRGRVERALWIDVPPGVGEARERAIGRAAGAVIDAVAAGRPVGLRVDGQLWPPRTGPAWRRQLLSVLAGLPGDDA